MSNTAELCARLLEHAAIHDRETSPYSPEQAAWAADLRDAAALIEAAPVVERADSATAVVERRAGNMSNDNAQNTPDHRPAVGGPVERMVRPGAEARWYCLSRDGMATLCTDEEDAKGVAAESWVAWPQNGPYRVAQMVDADTAESLRTALTELRDRIKGHPAYADLTEEMETSGDTAELYYLARVADAALVA